MVVLIIGIIALAIAIILYILVSRKIKFTKEEILNKYNNEIIIKRAEIEQINGALQRRVETLDNVNEEINKTIKEKNNQTEILNNLINQIEKTKEQSELEIKEKVKKNVEEIERLTIEQENKKNNIIETMQKGCDNYLNEIERNYLSKEKELDIFKDTYESKKQEIEEDIEKIKASLSAAREALLREQEKENNLDFYKLKVSESDLSDIKILEGIKPSLRQPSILSKLIWTTYFQKQTGAMCDRVLGLNTVMGIYKITNLKTQQCYIGQSVDTATRWKSHIKAGLDIDRPPTNKLYKNMLEYGVWNFTFELLEKCTKEELNEKEKFFIQLYQSDKFGNLNSTGGNG